ncbi:phage head closure protein [Halolactibacillus sp. JCM 19043]|uniref:phage head closure protein n=1 Tax=Halolactibacillus sp. JCM 19043 TaxID=1460638 RepID=UPI001E2B3312|nr:phage head closure protein [Halolactibacillus sp. JCM 19043]
MRINPGDLKQKLIFQQPAGGTNENGFPITQSVTYKTVWGALKTLRGNRFYTAAQNQMENNREFFIRYQKSLDETERPENLTVMWNQKEHEIVSIENDDGLNVSMTVVVKVVS